MVEYLEGGLGDGRKAGVDAGVDGGVDADDAGDRTRRSLASMRSEGSRPFATRDDSRCSRCGCAAGGAQRRASGLSLMPPLPPPAAHAFAGDDGADCAETRARRRANGRAGDNCVLAAPLEKLCPHGVDGRQAPPSLALLAIDSAGDEGTGER
eukprot:3043521-Pleurochrysis_carterae.AAC.1